ncbi:adenosine kinase [Brucella pseudintermedia]|uniref:adenosine kinase n=1 Tax=Brucella pseudintermedia TaxID=370111 RepID=UPI003208B846
MATFDVLSIGNAIVDILSRTDDSFLETNGIVKGAMNLIDADRAELLYSRIAGPATEMSGGSAGNTAAGVASLGGRSAYFGKVAADHLGRVFAHDIRAQGVAFDTRPLENGSPTARSMIFVTPDGERSMNTFLGACVELGPEDVETSKVSDAKVTYFEGYLWDPPRAKEAIVMASKIAHEKNRQMAMTLSDPFCVDRYRGEFLELMRSRTVDIVFANEDEAKSLYKTKSLETAIACMRMDCALSIITRSEKGAVVVTPDQTLTVPAIEIDALVDTTGAGDLYAAGFLYGYTNDRSLEDCARLGSLAAGMIIQQMGPRPQVSLQAAASQAGLV